MSTSQHSRTVLFQHQKLASPVILDRKEIAYHDSRLCFLSAQLPRKHFTIEMKPAQVCVIVTWSGGFDFHFWSPTLSKSTGIGAGNRLEPSAIAAARAAWFPFSQMHLANTVSPVNYQQSPLSPTSQIFLGKIASHALEGPAKAVEKPYPACRRQVLWVTMRYPCGKR